MKRGREKADQEKAPVTSLAVPGEAARGDLALGDLALGQVFLGEGAAFTGTLSARGQIRIEGSCSGRLESASLVVLAAGSKVDAEIEAPKAVIAGRFSGRLGAKEEVRLAASAQVEAEIRTASFSMDAGAVFRGRVIKTLP